MKTHPEAVLAASQTANLLVGDVKTAHQAAVREHPLLELTLRDLLTQARALEQRLVELNAALTAE
jgi:hypothetical protein